MEPPPAGRREATRRGAARIAAALRDHAVEAIIHFALSPVAQDAPLAHKSRHGWSKLMTEIMLRDAGAAHGLAWEEKLGRRNSAAAARDG